jgi:hypothetical protein
MNNYLIIGLVITMAGVLLWVYDKAKKRKEEDDFNQWLDGLDRRVDEDEENNSRNEG